MIPFNFDLLEKELGHTIALLSDIKLPDPATRHDVKKRLQRLKSYRAFIICHISSCEELDK